MPKKQGQQARGGLARAKALSAKRRSEIARAAAMARHHGTKQPNKPPTRVATFQVRMVLPPGATVRDAGQYVLDAVASYRGGLQPPGWGPGGEDPNEAGDPMHGLDVNTVQVAIMHKPSKVKWPT